jgi:hypothetical protein
VSGHILRIELPASVELQQFRDRLFVTGPSWGVEVRRGSLPDEIGRLLLDGLAGERARGRPLIESFTGMQRRDRAEKRGWEDFCRKVAGVEVMDYRPQIRIEVLDLREGDLRLRPAHDPVDPAHDTLLPDDVGAAELGAAALELLAATPPRWPTLRSAGIHIATRKRLVVYPSRFWAGSPLRIVPVDADARDVGNVVQRALRDSDAIDPESDRPTDFWEHLLASAGLNARQLAGRRAGSVSELADGSVQVEALRAVRGGWEGIGDTAVVSLPNLDAERLGRAVVTALVTWDPSSGTRLADAV